MSNVTVDNLVTVSQAAKELGIDHSLVHRYIKQGRLRAVQIGRPWYIDRESLTEFANQERRPGNPEFGPEFWSRKKSADQD